MGFRLSFFQRRGFWLAVFLVLFVLVAVITGANWWVLYSARPAIITDLALLPKNDVGLVLGTSRYNADGSAGNPFFYGRMNTAARLYREGKVRRLLVSGEHGQAGYDETAWMRDALIARGVPRSAITLDGEGFRTLDTMARARSAFGLHRFTIITDDFHEARSIFLARSLGLDVVGFPSERVRYRWSKKVRARELISRTVACLEVYILHSQPRIFGPKVELS